MPLSKQKEKTSVFPRLFCFFFRLLPQTKRFSPRTKIILFLSHAKKTSEKGACPFSEVFAFRIRRKQRARAFLPDQHAVLDDMPGNFVHDRDIAHGVTVHHDKIGKFSFLDRADLVVLINDLCGIDRRLPLVFSTKKKTSPLPSSGRRGGFLRLTRVLGLSGVSSKRRFLYMQEKMGSGAHRAAGGRAKPAGGCRKK